MLIFLTVLGVFVIWYALWGRPWLKSKPWMAWLYQSKVGEWVETHVFKKSETILWSRFLTLAGVIPSILEIAEKFNVPAVQGLLPEPLQGGWTIAFIIIGVINEMLRNRTTRPIEIVAAPEAVKAALPEVKEMEQAKVAAVEAVKVAEAEKVP